MSEHFILDWSKHVKTVWDEIPKLIPSSDQLLVDAYSAATGSGANLRSVDDVRKRVQNAVDMSMSTETPWLLYDTLAEFVRKLPVVNREVFTDRIRINNGHPYERLRLTPEGYWQIAWELDPDTSIEIKDREVALEWYRPQNYENAPVVPIPVVDTIASAVLLFRNDLVVPAATTLSIALEAALWDSLVVHGVPRSSERITYTPVRWTVKKKLSNTLLISVDGADQSIKDIDKTIGNDTIELEFQRLQTGNSATKIPLRVSVDPAIAGFLTSSNEISKEQVTDKSFSEAMQRARSMQLQCLEVVTDDVLDALVPLRNNLIHLPSSGSLDQPIPIPGKGQLLTVEDLMRHPKFVKSMLSRVVEIINIIYIEKMQNAAAISNPLS